MKKTKDAMEGRRMKDRKKGRKGWRRRLRKGREARMLMEKRMGWRDVR